MNPSTQPSREPSKSPSSQPSSNPSLSLNPSTQPSSAPSKNPSSQANPSARPSATPTNAPTKSPVKGTASPTKAPTKSPVKETGSPTKSPITSGTTSPVATNSPTNISSSCKDAGVKFKLKDKRRGCRWVRKKPDKIARRCNFKNVDSHCPNSCGKCAEFGCKDSARKFYLWGKDKLQTCDWVNKKPGKRARRCKKNGVMATCRESCRYCIINQ